MPNCATPCPTMLITIDLFHTVPIHVRLCQDFDKRGKWYFSFSISGLCHTVRHCATQCQIIAKCSNQHIFSTVQHSLAQYGTIQHNMASCGTISISTRVFKKFITLFTMGCQSRSRTCFKGFSIKKSEKILSKKKHSGIVLPCSLDKDILIVRSIQSEAIKIGHKIKMATF